MFTWPTRIPELIHVVLAVLLLARETGEAHGRENFSVLWHSREKADGKIFPCFDIIEATELAGNIREQPK